MKVKVIKVIKDFGFSQYPPCQYVPQGLCESLN